MHHRHHPPHQHDRHGDQHDRQGRRFARHDWGEEGRHGRFLGRSGLRRFFAHGDLRLVMLNLIAERPRHGYEIIKAIEEAVGGAYSPSPGVIYPTLTLLEDLGYVTVTDAGDGGKKLHTITDAGRAFLQANGAALQSLLARMQEARTARGGGPSPQILRAMENLKLALRMRLSRGPLSEEQANAVAAALDMAATSVERS